MLIYKMGNLHYTFSLAVARASCKDHLSAGHNSSGLYYINTGGSSFRVSTLPLFLVMY